MFSELHVERLLLFSLIWGFGGSLLPQDRLKYSQFLKSLSNRCEFKVVLDNTDSTFYKLHSLQLYCFNSLPDDDSDLLVFDYFVDESGEWDTWHPR